MSDRTRYCVRVTDRGGRVGWLLPSAANGSRGIGMEHERAVFESCETAEEAISKVSPGLRQFVQFEIVEC